MKRKLVYFLPALFIFSAFFGPESRANTPDEGYKMRKIVIDPGHGGKDAGCMSNGYKEKDLVLSVALRVGEMIRESLPDVEVIYTRKTDVFVELLERGNIANRARADLFLSIHVDAVGQASPNGSSSWVMGLSREESNLQLAMRENSVITYEDDYQTKYEGFDPKDPASYIKFALMQSGYFDQSIRLASILQRRYKQHTTINTDRGVKQAGFLVLHRTTMPSVLTEIGFLTNASDRAFMTSRAGKEKVARAIFEGICEYKDLVEGNSAVAQSTATTNDNSAAAEPARTAAENSAPASVSAQSTTVFRIQVSASRTRVDRSR
ncbi:N-acetylmuramoyl-L-alanine amidase, partial [Alistipes sp. OttesenSCG-928-L06]|nr:N-acetylmuramoyl-L-alanine amidase [Alistipes sp. OttesenSCG-928-L06]